ncbi:MULTISPECIES: glyoxalase [unclassified Nocardia]|uniref:glyoxalase n=1 Tax=unclassified Nocardia TaxID=2637762 RepID=UPI001CE418BD|nr:MULTISPECIES: glyoxalase [unclassified Nocardia]
MGDTTAPILYSGELAATLAFYRALGYRTVYEQTRPYVYAIAEANGGALHFADRHKNQPPPPELTGCVVFVDDIAARHREFTAALRAHYGKVPTKGIPRITRFRDGQSRFTLTDPAGNYLIYVQRDEPLEVEYGGSRELSGLPRVLDNARILRDFKNDDAAATRALEVGLGRFGGEASAVDRARAYAALTELAVAAEDSERAAEYRERLAAIELTGSERATVADELDAAGELAAWLNESR